jgi:hypothetical protein
LTNALETYINKFEINEKNRSFNWKK